MKRFPHGHGRRLSAALSLLTVGMALAGCTATNNPFHKPHTWHESANGGAVMYDMRAELANPGDLEKGHGPARPGTYGGSLAVKAVGSMGSGGGGMGRGLGRGRGGVGGRMGGVTGGVGGGGMGGSIGGIGGGIGNSVSTTGGL